MKRRQSMLYNAGHQIYDLEMNIEDMEDQWNKAQDNIQLAIVQKAEEAGITD